MNTRMLTYRPNNLSNLREKSDRNYLRQLITIYLANKGVALIYTRSKF